MAGGGNFRKKTSTSSCNSWVTDFYKWGSLYTAIDAWKYFYVFEKREQLGRFPGGAISAIQLIGEAEYFAFAKRRHFAFSNGECS